MWSDLTSWMGGVWDIFTGAGPSKTIDDNLRLIEQNQMRLNVLEDMDTTEQFLMQRMDRNFAKAYQTQYQIQQGMGSYVGNINLTIDAMNEVTSQIAKPGPLDQFGHPTFIPWDKLEHEPPYKPPMDITETKDDQGNIIYNVYYEQGKAEGEIPPAQSQVAPMIYYIESQQPTTSNAGGGLGDMLPLMMMMMFMMSNFGAKREQAVDNRYPPGYY